MQMPDKRDGSEIEKQQIVGFMAALEPHKQGKYAHQQKRCAERGWQFPLQPLAQVIAPAQGFSATQPQRGQAHPASISMFQADENLAWWRIVSISLQHHPERGEQTIP